MKSAIDKSIKKVQDKRDILKFWNTVIFYIPFDNEDENDNNYKNDTLINMGDKMHPNIKQIQLHQDWISDVDYRVDETVIINIKEDYTFKQILEFAGKEYEKFMDNMGHEHDGYLIIDEVKFDSETKVLYMEVST
jgi:hypothetical protein